jgi:hypothetical protein
MDGLAANDRGVSKLRAVLHGMGRAYSDTSLETGLLVVDFRPHPDNGQLAGTGVPGNFFR